jgi:hypothetical protein
MTMTIVAVVSFCKSCLLNDADQLQLPVDWYHDSDALESAVQARVRDPSPRFNAPTISSPIKAAWHPWSESLGPKPQSRTGGSANIRRRILTLQFSTNRRKHLVACARESHTIYDHALSQPRWVLPPEYTEFWETA